MGRHGMHREAQAYAKNWDRHLKSKAVTQQQVQDRDAYVANMQGLYKNLGA